MTAPAKPRQSPVRPVDALVAVTVGAVIASIIALGYGGQRPPDPVAYLFAAGFGALTLLRHRHPLFMTGVTVATIFAYYSRGYPPIGIAVPLVVALYATADAGRTRWAIGAAASVFGIAMGFRIGQGEPPAYLVGYEGVSNVALMVAAIALGSVVRSRRVRLAQQAEIARLAAEQSVREAQARTRQERMGLSRDLHDTVGHAMAVISLQAGVAGEAIGRDDAAARAAVEHIVETSNRSLREVRSMVRLLRGEESGTVAGIHPDSRSADGRPDDTGTSESAALPAGNTARRAVHSLSGVPDLIETTRRVGIATTYRLDVAPEQLPPRIDAAAYQVVQEALTNIVRHAAATEATVQVEIDDGILRIRVEDNGTAGTGADTGGQGYGLVGMSERVRLLGGTLTAHAGVNGGFGVDTRIPIEVTE